MWHALRGVTCRRRRSHTCIASRHNPETRLCGKYQLMSLFNPEYNINANNSIFRRRIVSHNALIPYIMTKTGVDGHCGKRQVPSL